MKSMYGESFRARLRHQTLKDISGLDGAAVGFCRPECCGPIPKGLSKSTVMGQHFYYSTSVPPTQWEARSENIPSCGRIQATIAGRFPRAGFTAFYDPDGTSTDTARLLRFDPPAPALTGDLRFAEYSLSLPLAGDNDPTTTALEADVALSPLADLCYAFVCAHTTRDARCGYCGPILADLLEQAVAGAGTCGSAKVKIYRCAHVGGHIYAGNVLIYNRHGAIAYGLVNPDDVEVMASALVAGDNRIPASLQERVRGKAGDFITIQ